jgi:transposase
MSGFVEGIDRSQSSLFPAALEDYVAEDNLVRAVDAFVEGLDLGKLGFGRFVPLERGRPCYHPATLLKIYIYGYLNRVPSSGRLERECQRNIELIWLTGHLVPDFKTIKIARGYNGTNNGRLGLSIRRASERCNIARGTAQRALVELQERGFVDCMTKGAFSRKLPHATEWRLTWWGCDVTGELPSKKFMSWGREKQTAVSKYPVAVSNQSQRAA